MPKIAHERLPFILFTRFRFWTLGEQLGLSPMWPNSHLVLLHQLCMLLPGSCQSHLELLHSAPQLHDLPLQLQLQLHQVIPLLLALIQLVLQGAGWKERYACEVPIPRSLSNYSADAFQGWEVTSAQATKRQVRGGFVCY